MPGTTRELPPSKRDGERRWELRVYVGRDPDRTVRDEDGRVIRQGPPVHVSRVFRGGERDAQRALDKLVAEVARDGQGRAVGTGATVGKLLTDWLATLERLGRAQSTVETYQIHVRKHLRPAFGATRLDRLTVHDIDRYLGDLADKGLSPRTIRLNHAVLRAALQQGVDWGWITANPAKGARLAKTPEKTKVTVTYDQLVSLHTAALADDIDMAAIIAVAMVTGARRGELCGLRWDDLDADARTLRIERQWVASEGGQHLADHTKSGTGRVVFIGQEGVDYLAGYRKAKAVQVGREPAGWMISPDAGATPMRARSVSEYVGRLAKRLKVPATVHTLRHWKQSELNRQGVDLPTAADQAGHTVAVMAGTYLHTDPTRAAEAGELIAGVVFDKIGPQR